ncbi:MAG: ATP synthase F1 subunit gamma [Actinobacteria bacterium HGW-Actinobacteria-7]|jgi:F-type H+-transporting ATPase subunit gamma|nr:MAG: ATP synthase F1 subunit gamma [Actinobacteria bacterium HGW-Actinobacteria-7]
MATLRDIKNRITSVHSTRQITRTMEMVSTAKIRKAQARIENARPYALAISEVLGNVVKNVSDVTHPLLEVREERSRIVLLAVTSDRGLAGAFNSNIIRMTERMMREFTDQGVEVELVTVGKKAAGYFRYRGIEPAMTLAGMSDKPTYEHARQLAVRVMDQYGDCSIDAVYLLFNRFKNLAEQKPESHQLLPIEHSVLTDAEADVEARGRNLEYFFEPTSESVLASLLPTYVEALIYRSLLESAASEHGARRTAMKSATDNATEMISTLTRSYNRARQAAITTEIAEIVGGAAALEDQA